MSFNAEDFNQVVQQYHLAWGEFMKGNPAPAKELYSQRDIARHLRIIRFSSAGLRTLSEQCQREIRLDHSIAG